jgi:hypothetical protein
MASLRIANRAALGVGDAERAEKFWRKAPLASVLPIDSFRAPRTIEQRAARFYALAPNPKCLRRAMRFKSIQITEIESLGSLAKDVFAGTLAIGFEDQIGDTAVGHVVSVKMRVSHKADATFSSLEEKLFSQCRDLLARAGQLLGQETLESLRQRERVEADAQRAKWDVS